MKINKSCPKCCSMHIIRINGNVGAHGSGNNILTGVTIFSAVKVARYVCCTCGYSEEWIDLEDIPALENKFENNPL